MQVEITGIVKAVLPTLSGTGRNGEWQKNQFVIEWMDNGYKQSLCLEVMGADRWDKMKQNVVVGNDVTVRFSVTSHEYNQRWFTSCSCFYCASVNGGGSSQQSNANVTQTNDAPTQAPTQETKDDNGGLPF